MPKAYEDYRAAVHLLAGRGYDVGRVAGISLGGCVDAIGTDRRGAMRRVAHAHTGVHSPNRGWICVNSGKESRILTATGRPTYVLIHEVAHIVTWDGHTARWGKAVTALGAPGEAKRYAAAAKRRKARAANTLYFHDNKPISRDEYIARTKGIA